MPKTASSAADSVKIKTELDVSDFKVEPFDQDSEYLGHREVKAEEGLLEDKSRTDGAGHLVKSEVSTETRSTLATRSTDSSTLSARSTDSSTLSARSTDSSKLSARSTDSSTAARPAGGTLFKCGLCSFRSRARPDLTAHFELAHEQVSYGCSLCEYKTRYPPCLEEHLRAKHKREAYVCEKCSWTAGDKKGLRLHMRTVHYRAGDYVALRTLLLRQPGETSGRIKCYKCARCEFVSRQKDLLIRHFEARHMES